VSIEATPESERFSASLSRATLSHRDRFCGLIPVSRASCAALGAFTPVSRATICRLSAIENGLVIAISWVSGGVQDT